MSGVPHAERARGHARVSLRRVEDEQLRRSREGRRVDVWQVQGRGDFFDFCRVLDAGDNFHSAARACYELFSLLRSSIRTNLRRQPRRECSLAWKASSALASLFAKATGDMLSAALQLGRLELLATGKSS